MDRPFWHNHFCIAARDPLVALGGILLLSISSARAEEPEIILRRSFAQPALNGSAPEVVLIEPIYKSPMSNKAARTLVPLDRGSLRLAAGKSSGNQNSSSPAPPVATQAPTAVPPPEVPGVAKKSPADWPKVLPTGKVEAAPAPDVFTADEIASAKARCAVILKGLDAVVTEEPPIKVGACGAPAPVQLISVGKNPQVSLSPPASMTCDMVVALHKWVSDDLQPLARKHLGAAVIGLQTMSSYSCRNAYGRKRGHLSEHGKANAVDIGSFIMADAHQTSVLADWGPTGWEIRAQIAAVQAAAKLAADKAAAAKAAADKAAAEKVAATKLKSSPGAQSPGAAVPSEAPSVGTIIEGVPGLANRLPGAGPANEGRTGYGLNRPSHLGGPRSTDKAANGKAAPLGQAPVMLPIDPASQSRKARFLREAHTAACKIFGTTLGPETNLAHKNHFHLDMAERTRSNYCE